MGLQALWPQLIMQFRHSKRQKTVDIFARAILQKQSEGLPLALTKS